MLNEQLENIKRRLQNILKRVSSKEEETTFNSFLNEGYARDFPPDEKVVKLPEDIPPEGLVITKHDIYVKAVNELPNADLIIPINVKSRHLSINGIPPEMYTADPSIYKNVLKKQIIKDNEKRKQKKEKIIEESDIGGMESMMREMVPCYHQLRIDDIVFVMLTLKKATISEIKQELSKRGVDTNEKGILNRLNDLGRLSKPIITFSATDVIELNEKSPYVSAPMNSITIDIA